jgi:KaiC/GvpD/RAD55 family RecA-like ATPase
MSTGNPLSIVPHTARQESDSIRPRSIPSTGGSDGSNSRSMFNPTDIAELYDEVEGDIPWVLDGYLLEGGLTLLAGPPKLGKSTFAYQLLVSVAVEEPFLGRDVTQGNVLVLALEEHRRDVIQRLVDNSKKDLSGLVRVEFGPLEFDKNMLEDIVTYIKREGIGLVMIDTLHAWWELSDEKDAAEVLRKGKQLLRAVRSTNAAWMGIVHTRKGGGEHGEEIRGSSALPGLVDIAISMKRSAGGDRQRRLQAITRYVETPRDLTIELSKDEYKVLGTPEEVSAAAKAERLWSCLTDDDQTTDELMPLSGLSKQDLSRAVHKLGDSCLRSGKGHRGDPYRYRRNSICPTSGSESGRMDETKPNQQLPARQPSFPPTAGHARPAMPLDSQLNPEEPTT